ncbi:FapA family protein [Bacillaceae bacterium CLA-AA-H227]|uniref:FapA family protein n=1 Tax=Robertmurraya yapensis (ex Hitch et al 2024) TaxID=3133160 RepID=A0ACC6SEA0_9BACI
MGQSILSRGRDIKEAIQQGLDILGTKQEQVSIEIIQQESKGFMGLRSKEAIVKLTKLEGEGNKVKEETFEDSLEEIEHSISMILENIEQVPYNPEVIGLFKREQVSFITKDKVGKVWIKDGRIYCEPTELKYPTITVCAGIKLLKNGELVKGTAVATKEDQFEIETIEEMVEPRWKITMDAQKLNVFLQVEPGFRKIYKVKDVEPDFHINIEVEEQIEAINNLEYISILEELEELRVIHGFNHSEIVKAVNTENPGKFVIATGIAPKDGENGRIEILTETKNRVGPKERADGSFDFREVKEIPTVQKGQVIALVHMQRPGLPGATVTNEPIPPKPTFPLTIHTGKGVALIENGTKIVATESGRPVIEEKGLLTKVAIMQKLVHPGDITFTSGNLRFKGDIDILGNVEDGMLVEADGEVSIYRNVFSSTVASREKVIISGNAINSTITAGQQNVFASELIFVLTQIHEQLVAMNASIKQLMNLPAFKTTDFSRKGLLSLIKILVEKKFKPLIIFVKQFSELTKSGVQLINNEWLTLDEQLRLCFLSSISNEYHTIDGMNSLLRKIEEMLEKHDPEKDQDCLVEMKYAHNSLIFSGGDVLIKGQGCYNSKIHAGGSLVIHGVLRGGEVYARLGVTIKEAGSDGGVVSKIMVPSKVKIKIGLAKEGTVIQIGKAKYTFQKEQKNIAARLDENERIVF